MTEPRPPQNHLQDALKARETRQRIWQTFGERSLARNLGMIGAIGWLVVAPILLGLFVGRWLDTTFNKGITFSGGLIMVGAAVGGWLAWKRMNAE